MTKEKKINTSIQHLLNRHLDRIVHPEVSIMRRSFTTYKIWIYTGVITGTALIFVLSSIRNISLPVMAELVLIVAFLSFLLFENNKIFNRQYPLLEWAKKSVYHFQIIALVFTVLFLWLMHKPILVYLDILIVGLLVYQAFGRIGCFMAGCCHGRPHSWGVCYGAKYASTGYPYFVNRVRLLPVQLFESAWLFILTSAAIVIVVEQYPRGENLSWYIIGYGLGRFFFDFLRGNLKRVYIWGFSESQWTAIILALIVITLELLNIIKFHWWHVTILFVMALSIGILSLIKRFQKITKQQILQPDHIMEIFQTVNWITSQASLFSEISSFNSRTEEFLSGTTSLGIQISLIKTNNEKYSCEYQLLQKEGALNKNKAKILSQLIVDLKYPGAICKVLNRKPGIFLALITYLKELPYLSLPGQQN